jgi:hypothetical protein
LYCEVKKLEGPVLKTGTGEDAEETYTNVLASFF